MTSQAQWPVAIIGAGNLGTDLMVKIARGDGPLTVAAMVGIDGDVDGLAHAERMGVPTTNRGVEGLLTMPEFRYTRVIFDATSANAHRVDWPKLSDTGVRIVGLGLGSIGPWCVPAVNLDDHLDALNLNMVTGDAQVTIPIVAAVARGGIVSYAEVVSSISAKSVGPASRANLDGLTETTAAAVEAIGGAQRGKAMMILNPADPPIPARNTVYCLIDGDADPQRIEGDVLAMVDKVRTYVPGYRLKQPVQFETFTAADPLYIAETGKFTGTRVTVLLEVTGAAAYLPTYAGNLDVLTSAAKATVERIAAHAGETAGAPT